MSQAALASAIGKSIQSVQGYEHGRTPPPDVIEILKTLSVQHGHPEFAIELGGDAWAVKHVIHPGETLIKAHVPAAGRHAEWHELLDVILNSGDPDAIPAVQSNLVVFGKYVRAKQTRELKPRKKTS